MLPVASSSQSNDPSPKAEVNTSERTVCFRKPSSSKFIYKGNVYEFEIEGLGALKGFRSSSQETSRSRVHTSSVTSSSTIDEIEYRRLNTSDDSVVENPSSRTAITPKATECNLHQINHKNSRSSQFIETYINCTREIVNSWNILPVYVVLLGLTAQLAYMGSAYSAECPFLEDGASMVFLMGTCGVGAALSQTLTVVQKQLSPQGSRFLHATQIISCVCSAFFIGTFCIELHRFTSVDGLPSSRNQDHNYCNPGFYGYVCWSNITFSLLTVMLFIIFAPLLFKYVFKRC